MPPSEIIRPDMGITKPDLTVEPTRRPDLRRADMRNTDAKEAVFDGSAFRGASFKNANFDRADFTGASFSNVTMTGAEFEGMPLGRRHIILTGLLYLVVITDSRMFLGCEHHTHEEWAEMSDEAISAMDDPALEFWYTWREPLLSACATIRRAAI